MPPAAQSAPVFECSTEIQTAENNNLDARIAQTQRILSGLSAFASGQALSDVPFTALFAISLRDEVAVAQQLASLRAVAAVPVTQSDAERCARSDSAYDTQWAELDRMQSASNRLRLEILGLPAVRRQALVDAQTAALQFAETAKKLQQERLAAEAQKAEAARQIQAAATQALQAENAELKALAEQRGVLERSQQEWAHLAVNAATGLEQRTREYSRISESLSAINTRMSASHSRATLQSDYAQANAIWRNLVDNVLTRIADQQQYEPIPALPQEPLQLLAQIRAGPERSAYIQSYQAAGLAHQALSRERATRFAAERAQLFRLLLRAGDLRSRLLQDNLAVGDTEALALSGDYFADLSRELRIVPYRLYAFVIGSVNDLHAKTAEGWRGWLDVVRQLCQILLFLVSPYLAYRISRRMAEGLDRLRENIIRDQFQQPEARQQSYRMLALFIYRIRPYATWLILLAALLLAEPMVANTAFAEIAAILPYLAYYVAYRLFVLAISAAMNLLLQSGSLKEIVRYRQAVHTSARRLGRFFFIALGLLHLVSDTVGEALVYRIVFTLMVFLGIAYAAILSRRWAAEICAVAPRVLPDAAAALIEKYCRGLSAWFCCLPALMIVIAALMLRRARARAGEASLFKRIGAEFFRRRIEGAAAQNQSRRQTVEETLPAQYRAHFDLAAPAQEDVLIEPHSGVIDQIHSAIEIWRTHVGASHVLALLGDKGSGKSSLLRVIETHSPDYRVARVSVPAKLTQPEEVLNFFRSAIDALDASTPTAEGEAKQPALILVDEAQNLFLAEPGGFAGYRTFMDLVNADSQNYFWCVAINKRSACYLQGVFGVHQHFQQSIDIPPMSDEDIRRLINLRHDLTPHDLSYDQIIHATHGGDDFGDTDHIETQFFRLLWGQSKGNPRAAMMLWLSSLQPSAGDVLRVGIPQHRAQRKLSDFDDDALFVFAAIVRHENLNADEVMRTTNLPRSVVMDALRAGVDCLALICDAQQRYRISATAQFALLNVLLGKNFIHE